MLFHTGKEDSVFSILVFCQRQETPNVSKPQTEVKVIYVVECFLFHQAMQNLFFISVQVFFEVSNLSVTESKL